MFAHIFLFYVFRPVYAKQVLSEAQTLISLGRFFERELMQIPTAVPNLVGGEKGTDVGDILPKLVWLPSLLSLLQKHTYPVLHGRYLEDVLVDRVSQPN